MQIKSFQNAPKLSQLQNFSVIVQSGSIDEIRQALRMLQQNPDFTGPAWVANFAKLARVIDTGMPEFKIFALGGNSKLPFVAFSTLPGVTCPGAGECLSFCYSFRAHRYPAAYARQAQNAFLMRFYRAQISQSMREIYRARPDGFDFRLYVDGDFAHYGDVSFWFSMLQTMPKIRAYGYSKSFEAILHHVSFGGLLPHNYMLNISSGHNASPAIVDKIKALSITRGEFIAVSVGKKVKSSDHGTRENNAAIRAAMGETKVFPCPGQCGTCTGAGHACGLPQMKGRVIAIAVH